MKKIDRLITNKLLRKLRNNPAIALNGSCQIDIPILAKMIVDQFGKSVYLNLDSDTEKIDQV